MGYNFKCDRECYSKALEDQTPWCEDCILALESWGGSGYVTQPKGFVVNGSENKVCKLHKVLYGLKYPPRA